MTTTDLSLDKKAHPLMMHLSIIPKIEIPEGEFKYDPKTQTSNVTAMSGSWCTRHTSTGSFLETDDEDQKEDD